MIPSHLRDRRMDYDNNSDAQNLNLTHIYNKPVMMQHMFV